MRRSGPIPRLIAIEINRAGVSESFAGMRSMGHYTLRPVRDCGRAAPALALAFRLGGLVQFLQKAFRLHRLDEMQLEACLAGALLVLLAAIRSDGDQARTRRGGVAPERARQRVAVAVGQPDVAQDDVRPGPLRGFETFPAAVGNRNRIAAKLEQRPQA